MAKGQKKSNREAKKPKKTAAERAKSSVTSLMPQASNSGGKPAPKKA